eukprot:COSAG03_NODE_27649_length_252_cov_0.594771_1_plen_67_part_10
MVAVSLKNGTAPADSGIYSATGTHMLIAASIRGDEHNRAAARSAFFKQKTAYEMESRDWSSDVCSSD